MKFGEIIDKVKPNKLDTLSSKVLQLLGQRYIEKHSNHFLANHTNQPIANELIKYATKYPNASGLHNACALVNCLGMIENRPGWMSEKISFLLNKALGANIAQEYTINHAILKKEPKHLKDEFVDFLIEHHPQLKNYSSKQIINNDLPFYDTSNNNHDSAINHQNQL
ncbi:hypothetical protein L3V83_02370 [Thiotrichales bacterium 19X7-9]|nr:hypothetical protein [Thiotrichales bacterium 19X7-9]